MQDTQMEEETKTDGGETRDDDSNATPTTNNIPVHPSTANGIDAFITEVKEIDAAFQQILQDGQVYMPTVPVPERTLPPVDSYDWWMGLKEHLDNKYADVEDEDENNNNNYIRSKYNPFFNQGIQKQSFTKDMAYRIAVATGVRIQRKHRIKANILRQTCIKHGYDNDVEN